MNLNSQQGFAGGPGAPGVSQSPQLTINPFEYETETCPECGNITFVPGVIFKKVPGVLVGSPNPTEAIPIKVAVCAKCGTMSQSDAEMLKKNEESARKTSEAKKSSNLIV